MVVVLLFCCCCCCCCGIRFYLQAFQTVDFVRCFAFSISLGKTTHSLVMTSTGDQTCTMMLSWQKGRSHFFIAQAPGILVAPSALFGQGSICALGILDKQRWQIWARTTVLKPSPTLAGSCGKGRSRHHGILGPSSGIIRTTCTFVPCWNHWRDKSVPCSGSTPTKLRGSADTSDAEDTTVWRCLKVDQNLTKSHLCQTRTCSQEPSKAMGCRLQHCGHQFLKS